MEETIFKETILLYNITCTKQRSKIMAALLPMRLRVKTVPLSEYNQPLGVLGGISTLEREESAYAGDDLPEAMMVFAGLTDKRIDEVLQALVRLDVNYIRHKAILTTENKDWNSVQLFSSIAQG